MEALGIDIGGSGIKGAVIETASGEFVSERLRLETPQPATHPGGGRSCRRPGARIRLGRTGRLRFPGGDR